jgi:outer membrane protein assembly factor BamB
MNFYHTLTTLFLIAVTATQAGDWPQWLGPTRDARTAAGDALPDKLAPELKVAWRLSIGGGFSSPVVASNQVAFFDEDGQKEVLHLVDASSGKEFWKVPVADRYIDEWGAGPRSTPFFDGDRVYAQSCSGEFRCLDLKDGKTVWGCSFEKDFGVPFLGSKANEGTAARRGNNGSGILDGDSVILPVGSTNGATLVCFNKLTGKVAWKSGNDEAAYSSVQVATFGGVRQVVYISARTLMGLDRKSGDLLWSVPLRTAANRHAATPVISGDQVFVNSHTFGTICFQITKAGPQWKVEQKWVNKELKINLATPVLVDGFFYSHGSKKSFVCASAQTGELIWEQAGFGRENSSTLTDGRRLLIISDDGQLVLASCDSKKYAELGRNQACGKNWNFPAYANGRLYLRDQRELVCYQLQP